MKNKQDSTINNNLDEKLLPEYNFDYSKARPNRFVNEVEEKTITITLDSDVAEVFTTSEQVNQALRAILSAIPEK
ncbi:hypothetical protein [Crocosphaera sp.]|uniref:hypothetical protein n=1 Tax=Crocosphaera sp. TaxID=2729996 RepID=UPI003F1EBD2A|nr:hypothetical protein [Crocosphaera sp.]